MFPDSAQARTASPAFLDCSWLNRRAAYGIVIAVILGIYSYPALRTAVATRSLRLPAVSAPDLGLYLSLSKLEKDRDGTTLNPYYRIPVPYPVGYLKFRLGPALFGLLNNLLASRIWWSLFVWNLFWWGSLCLSAIWLFERWLPQPTVELVLVSVSLLTLFGVDEVSRVITGWIHLSPTWLPGGLPYIRPFTPQVIAPLLLLYLGLQIRALSGKNVTVWGLMAVLQFVAFTFFPYGTLVMAGTTAVAVSWYILARRRNSAWHVVLGFVLVCAFADIAFALHGSGGFRYSFPDQTSLINFQPATAGKSIGRLWLLTGILVAATVMTRKLRPEVKWPLVGMGVTTMFFILGDAIFSERLFLLGIHMGYFYQSTIIILFIFLASAYLPGGAQGLRLTRIVSLATVGLCFVYGVFMAEGNYRTFLPYNLVQADLASWFGRGEVSDGDLVITQYAGTQCDPCEWIPLLSDAQVLYCRNAQLALTSEQNRDVQRPREVMYLYLDGKDHQWLENATNFEWYGLYGELSSFRRPEERTARVVALRREMLPFFERIENGDPSIHDFFRRFRRIWIIQDRQNPALVDARLRSYLDLKEQEIAGSLQINSANPR
jgi:hypothetical protein